MKFYVLAFVCWSLKLPVAPLAQEISFYPPLPELDAMMKEVDSDGSGDIDFHEFVTVMSRRVQADYTPEQLKVSPG